MTAAALHSVMTDAEYEVAREKLRATYGDSRAEAGARFEQSLAKLFHRSGWTQEKLAEREGKSRQHITRLLCFGRFLNSAPVGAIPETALTERRFRNYWEQTDGDERARFRDVVKLMQSEMTFARSTIPKGHPKKIVEKFGDTKWHSLPVISKHLDTDEDEVERSLAGMVKDGRGNAKTEIKTVGGVKHYRFFKNVQMISSTELIEKLAPIVEELKEQGKRNMVTMDPMAVAVLAARLRRLLDEWAE